MLGFFFVFPLAFPGGVSGAFISVGSTSGLGVLPAVYLLFLMCRICCLILCDAAKRLQEVEELRQKLQEVELGTVLSQADSNFLQRELEEKEADIGK